MTSDRDREDNHLVGLGAIIGAVVALSLSLPIFGICRDVQAYRERRIEEMRQNLGSFARFDANRNGMIDAGSESLALYNHIRLSKEEYGGNDDSRHEPRSNY